MVEDLERIIDVVDDMRGPVPCGVPVLLLWSEPLVARCLRWVFYLKDEVLPLDSAQEVWAPVTHLGQRLHRCASRTERVDNLRMIAVDLCGDPTHGNALTAAARILR